MSLWPNKGEADTRPPLGSGDQRVPPAMPREPVVPAGAPGELRLDARKSDVIPSTRTEQVHRPAGDRTETTMTGGRAKTSTAVGAGSCPVRLGGGRIECSIGGGRAGVAGGRSVPVAGAVMEGCGFAGQRGEGVQLRRFEVDVGCCGVGAQLVGEFRRRRSWNRQQRLRLLPAVLPTVDHAGAARVDVVAASSRHNSRHADWAAVALFQRRAAAP